MTMVLLRDDDANATTQPERIARTYAPLLDAGIPINLSVIPSVALDTLAPDGMRERFIDNAYSPSSAQLTITPETPLIRWVRANQRLVGVFLHGYNHKRVRGGTELGSLTHFEAEERLRIARRILEEALDESVDGVVAPWDAWSRGALAAASHMFSLISTSWISGSQLALHQWFAHLQERARKDECIRLNKAHVLRHRGGAIHNGTPISEVSSRVAALTKGARIGVIVLHHWMFWEQQDPHPVVVQLAKALKHHQCLTVGQSLDYLEEKQVLRYSQV